MRHQLLKNLNITIFYLPTARIKKGMVLATGLNGIPKKKQTPNVEPRLKITEFTPIKASIGFDLKTLY